MTQTEPNTIVAVVGEDGRFDPVLRTAVDHARRGAATVILWDVDAGRRLFESPVPTAWSADGEEEQFRGRLTTNDLEALGRGPLADKVRAVRDQGVDAYAWLPENGDAEALRSCVTAEAAALVLVPAGEEQLTEGLQQRVTVVGSARE